MTELLLPPPLQAILQLSLQLWRNIGLWWNGSMSLKVSDGHFILSIIPTIFKAAKANPEMDAQGSAAAGGTKGNRGEWDFS
jgi:hypothetical protein